MSISALVEELAWPHSEPNHLWNQCRLWYKLPKINFRFIYFHSIVENLTSPSPDVLEIKRHMSLLYFHALLILLTDNYNLAHSDRRLHICVLCLFQLWLKSWLGPIRCQAIFITNADFDTWVPKINFIYMYFLSIEYNLINLKSKSWYIKNLKKMKLSV